jgi:signal transduction histidine kinase
MPRFFFILFFLAYWFTINAQEAGAYHIEVFNTDNGLPSNGIKGLQWDHETGFLWIATEAGIVRYNGLSFKTFTADDGPQLTNERIAFLLKNNAGRIFTSDVASHIFYVEKNRLRFMKTAVTPDGMQEKSLAFIQVSDKMYNKGADFKKGLLFVRFTPFLPVNDTSTFFLYDRQLYYHSLFSLQPLLVSRPGEKWVQGFMIGKECFLIDSNGQVYHYAFPSGKTESLVVREKETSAILDSKDSRIIWENGMVGPIIFNRNKAWQLVYSNGSLWAEMICDEVPDGLLVVHAQYNAKQKILVIGTDSKGILVIRKNGLVSMKTKEASPNLRTSYYAQVELAGGNVLTNEGHSIGNSSVNPRDLPVKGEFSVSIFKQGDSVLFYSQYNPSLGRGCLYRYNYSTRQTKAFPKIPYQLMESSAGEIYMATDIGIAKLQGDSLQYLHRFSPKETGVIYYDMKETEPGVLAIANCRGLLQYTIAANRLDTLFNAGNYCVRTIWKYRDYLFFGTYGNGLYAYKNGKVKALPLDKNRYLLYTHCFVKDEEDNCWISTNKGLFKIQVAQLTAAVDNNFEQLYYHYFGKKDGMDMTELNGGCKPCALVMKNKIISFPSMDGLLWVDPQTTTVSLPEGEIYVDEIMVDSTKFDEASLAAKELAASTSELVFRLAFPAWCNLENIYLEYQLKEGSGWKPVPLSEVIELRFSNLPHGHYNLRIRKLDGSGANAYTYKNLSFTIETPWYQRPLFYFLSSLLLAVIVVSFFYWRIRHLRRKQIRLQKLVDEKTKELQEKNEVLEKADSIKTRLISIISHDIVTPLKFLTSTSRNLVEKRTLMPDELQQETLEEMMNTSQELQQLSTNILNWIKYQNENRRLTREIFNVHELMNEVCRIFKSVAKEKGLQLLNGIDKDLSVHQYREPLKILLYNLFSNAINFSEKGTIRVINEANEKNVILVVTDEGIGMTTNQVNNILSHEFIVSSENVDNRKGNGLGYLIIKDLVKMMNAELAIKSEKGSGTTVTILLRHNSQAVT